MGHADCGRSMYRASAKMKAWPWLRCFAQSAPLNTGAVLSVGQHGANALTVDARIVTRKGNKVIVAQKGDKSRISCYRVKPLA